MNVVIYQPRILKMNPKDSKRVEDASQAKTCLVCAKASMTRGLCNACYQASRRAIRAGTVTESELVLSGRMLSLDESPIGRPPTNPVTVAIQGADTQAASRDAAVSPE